MIQLPKLKNPPDLLNPYNCTFSKYPDFSNYIGLERLVEEMAASSSPNQQRDLTVFPGTQDKKSLLKNELLNILSNIPLDINTVQYRQEIMCDLIENNQLAIEVENLKQNLSSLYYLHSRDYISFLSKLQQFCNNLPNLSNAKSKGLKSIADYFNQLKETTDLTEVNDYFESLKNVQGVHLVVKLDSRLRPRFITAAEVAIKGKPSEMPSDESIFTELIGNKLIPGFQSKQVTTDDKGVTFDSLFYTRDNRYFHFEETFFGELLVNLISRELILPANSLAPYFDPIFSVMPALELYTSVTNYFRTLKSQNIDISFPTILDKEARKMEVETNRNWRILNYKPCVANDVFTNDKRLFIITGPNDGGKTTYIEAIGQTQFLAQQGLPIIAQRGTVSMVDGLYAFTTSSLTAKNGAGQFHQELSSMKDLIYNKLTPHSILLVDELGRGTNSEEAETTLQRVLRGFEATGTLVFFATHLHKLADYDSHLQQAECLKTDFMLEGNALQLKYKVVPGKAGKSHAEYIATKLNFTDESMTIALEKRGLKKR